jgi:acetaldehyde dehydrogenase (acetylating)
MLQDPDLLALQEVRTKVERAWVASQKFRAYSQEQVDAIVEAAAAAARQHAAALGELAVQETGYGNARDKLAKNLLSADLLPRSMRGIKTVGILKECKERQVVEIAVPMGVIAAILPTTNPTSTAIYKVLIALKAGNAIVLSPHPRASRCTCATAEVLSRAAAQAGAPEGIIECVGKTSIEATNELMRHKRVAAILSTGGSGIVRAAYSSGKPAFGVGPGNVPVVIERSADIDDAVRNLLRGKSFDNGTLCSSEQTMIAEAGQREAVLAALKSNGGYMCDASQAKALEKLLLLPPKFAVNPKCVGQSAVDIAKMAGFQVPAGTTVLAVEIGGVGKEHPLSAEKLSPVLSVLFVADFAAALNAAEAVLQFGGLGHTCGIYSRDDARIREFAFRMPAMRVLCNTPTPQGSVGITTNLQPAMTLGCGAIAGNITGDNIGPRHLMNIKRLAYGIRSAEEALPMPKEHEKPGSAPGVAGVATRDIGAAVERFLAQRGLTDPEAQKATPAKPATRDTADVVDRFLTQRKPLVAQAPACPAPPQPATAAEPSPPPFPAAAPPPAVTVVDFVCEMDVRQAVQKSQKIYIGPKTIVTPAARDLASQHDTFVITKPK